jgi:four helix bundle protein
MNSDGVKGLESLQVWQKAEGFAITICKDLLPTFPAEEKYALTDQLRRSAQSIPSNIAEGFGRYYFQEGIRFCYIARGSLNETLSHLYLAKGMGYVTEQEYKRFVTALDEINRMLSGYIAFLKKSKRGAAEYGHSVQEDFSEYIVDDPEQPGEFLP